MIKDFCTALTLIILVLVAGCSAESNIHSKSESLSEVSADGKVPERTWLPQGWDADTRTKFWFTSQGARIIPYTWFMWLEQADSEQLFRHTDHMEMLRYLPIEASSSNPAGLPIGFVADHDKDTGEAWMGMTCAACHTHQIDYQGNKLLVDGAPTLANFVLFFDRLVSALNETQKNDAKFDRFAKKVLADNYSENAAKALRQAVSDLALSSAERVEVNRLPDSLPEDFTSYARLDAFGNIQNAGTAFALNDLANRNIPNGPVSYPFLWGTHQSDVVQWNASAPNTPIVGPLARNVGEVVGVFGGLSISEASWWQKLLGKKHIYSSHIDIEGLGYLESMVKTLKSPAWPVDVLPSIDQVKAAQGSVLFAETCQGCHQVIAREDEGNKYKATQVPIKHVGTDPVTATNADRHCAKTLTLEGTKKAILIGDDFGPISAAIEIPVNGSIGVILNQPIKALEAGLRPIRTKTTDSDTKHESLESHLEDHLAAVQKKLGSAPNGTTCGDPNKVLVYKARPLNGIWATAPYLHNGSVPNLRSMLDKPEDRPTSFWVGSREFDPMSVGYLTDKGLNEFQVLDKQGEIQAGNSNRGHDYGTDWSDEEKWAVVEYLKTL